MGRCKERSKKTVRGGEKGIMDNIQKQIIGYLLMAVVGAVVIYLAGKLELWILDPSLLISIGIILGALETAAYKWVRYTFRLPEEQSATQPPATQPQPIT